jgi:hypothetical protein
MGISSVSDGSRYHTAAHWICQVFGDYLGGPTLARLKIGERKSHDDHVAAYKFRHASSSSGVSQSTAQADSEGQVGQWHFGKRRPSGADHEEQPPELAWAVCGPTVEAPRSFLSTLKAGFFLSAQTGLETALLAGRPHRDMGSRQRLRMSITGSSSGDV